MKEYEIYSPPTHHDGTSVEPEFTVLFRGATYFPQKNEGFWTYGGLVFRDEIVIYRVLSDKTRAARKFFRQLKEELK